MTGEDIAAVARSWVGTKYAHGQHRKGVGCDCIGLVAGVALELGFPSGDAWSRDPQFKGYGPEPDPVMLLDACRKYLVPIAQDKAVLGDILLFAFEGRPRHFGIITNLAPRQIVHSYVSARKVAENNIDGAWRQDITWTALVNSAWRYKEIA